MMKTLGKVKISNRQLSRLHLVTLPAGVYSVRVVDGKTLDVESSRDLTDTEEKAILASVAALDDSPTIEEMDLQVLDGIKKKEDKDISLTDIAKVLRIKRIL